MARETSFGYLGVRCALVLLLAIALSGCAVQFVSGYDGVIDNQASETQQSIR